MWKFLFFSEKLFKISMGNNVTHAIFFVKKHKFLMALNIIKFKVIFEKKYYFQTQKLSNHNL